MGRIKGWKKFSENSRGARWKSRNSDKYVYISPRNSSGRSISTIRKGSANAVYDQNYKRNQIDEWEAGLGNKSKVMTAKSFDTKEDAKDWAISYMRNNPQG